LGRTQKKYLILLSIFLTCLTTFQNCSYVGDRKTDSKKTSDVFTSKGGEQGYEGKLQYASRLLSGVCQDGSDIENRIDLSTDMKSAKMTRKNCSEIAAEPVDMNTLDILPHNLSDVPRSSDLFELMSGGKLPDDRTVVFCRGPGTKIPGDNFRSVVDIKILKALDGSFKGRIILGKYDLQGNLISIRDSGEVVIKGWDYKKDPSRMMFIYRTGKKRQWVMLLGKNKVTQANMFFYGGTGDHARQFPCLRML
jgi:hypothetical protein